MITYDTFTQWNVIKSLKYMATSKIFLAKCKVKREDKKIIIIKREDRNKIYM